MKLTLSKAKLPIPQEKVNNFPLIIFAIIIIIVVAILVTITTIVVAVAVVVAIIIAIAIIRVNFIVVFNLKRKFHYWFPSKSQLCGHPPYVSKFLATLF